MVLGVLEGCGPGVSHTELDLIGFRILRKEAGWGSKGKVTGSLTSHAGEGKAGPSGHREASPEGLQWNLTQPGTERTHRRVLLSGGPCSRRATGTGRGRRLEWCAMGGGQTLLGAPCTGVTADDVPPQKACPGLTTHPRSSNWTRCG